MHFEITFCTSVIVRRENCEDLYSTLAIKEDLAKIDHEIANLENKNAKMKEAAADEHNRRLEVQGVLEVSRPRRCTALATQSSEPVNLVNLVSLVNLVGRTTI